MPELFSLAVVHIGVSLALAAILILVYRRLQRADFLVYWALFWVTIATILAVSQVAIPLLQPLGWAGPGLAALSVSQFPVQIGLMLCAALSAGGDFLRRDAYRLLGAAGAIGISLGFVQYMLQAGSNLTLARSRTLLTASAVAFFAYRLATGPNAGTKYAGPALASVSVVYAIHNAGLGLGFYGPASYSPLSATMGILLQFALTIALTYGAIEHASEASREARESSRRFQGLLESVGVAGVIVGGSGRVEFANAWLVRALEEPAEAIIGRPWLESFVVARERPAVEAVFRKGLDIGTWPALHEYTVRASSGREIVLQWYHTSLRDTQGKIIGAASLGADVSQQRIIENELRQSQRMETLGRLAGGVAHDFNNHLTVINGFSDLLLRRLPPGDPAREHAKHIRDSGDLAATLTAQLLTFSRRQNVVPRPISLNETVTNMTAILRRLVRENVLLEMDLAPEVGCTLADPGQLDHVVLNLVLNASDSISGPGKVLIGTRAFFGHRPPGPGELPLADQNYLVLTVEDTGAGMDAWTRQRIFEPFFTTKPDGKGTGLGLATVHGAVSQAGGWIEVSSELGKGSVFSVYLPSTGPAREASPVARRPGAPASECLILLVEDQDLVRQFSAAALAAEGYRVLEASSGSEALEMASRTTLEITVLVTDIVMPEMSGDELASTLKASRPDLSTLFISGYTFDRQLDTSAEARQEFLRKPYTAEQLCEKVANMVSAGRVGGSGY